MNGTITECTNNESTNINQENEDVWESVINDDQFYINNKIARIFPILKNFSNFSKIKIDEESFCYITIREIADTISKIICEHLLNHNLNPQRIIICDYTAGVGGNVLSFCKYFKYVHAIEIEPIRTEFIKNNIEIYGYKNVNVLNMCAIEFNELHMINLNPHIIFVDPPWGGSNYKNNDLMILSLGSIQLEKLLIDIIKKFSSNYLNSSNSFDKLNNYNNKFIVLKLPKNYDLDHFYNWIKLHNNFPNYDISIYLYILNKMLIIVCELKYKT